MQSYIRRVARIPLLALVALLGACDSQSAEPTAPASAKIPSSSTRRVERRVDERESDMEGVLTRFICDDGTETELVALEGKLFIRDVVSVLPSGGYHVTTHTMAVGLRGIGTESGHEYRVREQNHFAVSQRVIGYAGTSRTVFELYNRQTMQTYKLVQVNHYTTNANGEIVIEREQVRAECGK